MWSKIIIEVETSFNNFFSYTNTTVIKTQKNNSYIVMYHKL